MLAAVLASSVVAACGNGGSQTRTIEVDYHSDQFAGTFLGYYPHKVTVAPGMTLKFHQTWSGAPHSVTLGTAVETGVQSARKIVSDYLDRGIPYGDAPPPDEYLQAITQHLPFFFADNGTIDQGAAQPCDLKNESDLPLGEAACTKAQQKLAAFTGREAYYSSGIIPFEGASGNTFEMKIADNAKAGTYFFYCNVHGALMSGELTVKPNGKVESQASINRRGQQEAGRISTPVLAVLHKEQAGKSKISGDLSGSGDSSLESVEGQANEFTPRTIETPVSKPVTWTFVGDHSISFNVPPYAPIYTFAKNGTVTPNDSLARPHVWPGAPKRELTQFGPPPPAVHIDAGTWDGSGGLHSSGTGWTTGDTYTVTFTRKGTYPYACLIHPGMIGKVVVK